jgi:hypothetical protein
VLVYILLGKCFLKHVIDGRIGERTDVMGRRGKRRKQILDDLKKTRGHWKLIGEALGRVF